MMGYKTTEYRNIQLTGKSTFIVSLPKDWITSIGLKKGDTVVIENLGDFLILKPLKEEKHGDKLAVIYFDSKTSLAIILRTIVSAYLAGANIIKILFEDGTIKFSDNIKTFVKEKLMGFEILEESSNFMVIQSLIKFNELSFKRVLERMWLTAYYMIEDVIKALKTNDIELAENISKRDDEVDRFHFYATRQIRQSLEDPKSLHEIKVERPEYILEYKSIIKSIERIADHASRIAKLIRRLNKRLEKNLLSQIEELANKSLSMFKLSMVALSKMDEKLAHRVLDDLKGAQELEEHLTSRLIIGDLGGFLKPLELIIVKLILDSLRRIAEYSSDIAEGILNLRSPIDR